MHTSCTFMLYDVVVRDDNKDGTVNDFISVWKQSSIRMYIAYIVHYRVWYMHVTWSKNHLLQLSHWHLMIAPKLHLSTVSSFILQTVKRRQLLLLLQPYSAIYQRLHLHLHLVQYTVVAVDIASLPSLFQVLYTEKKGEPDIRSHITASQWCKD